MNPKVDAYIRRTKRWPDEVRRLREILLDCPLTEELKWRIPCYTVNGRNLVAINALKHFCALAFFQGALLSDPHRILEKPGEHTQAGRWVKFTSVREIDEKESILKVYVLEAVEAEKAGLKFVSKKKVKFKTPAELQQQFNKSPAFKIAFDLLTPGRQRGYVLYFSAAKQSKTRESRIVKSMPQIFSGKGMNE
jgi:uncharacterized protein YdeI (YjbR/CyaY-like superfamily)